MQTAVMVLFVLNAVTLIGIVLIQQGKGADAGAAFGSGASATVFGARGSSNFLSRFTAILATIFFVLAMVLAFMSRDQEVPQSLTERMPLTDYSADPEPATDLAPVPVPAEEQAPAEETTPAEQPSSDEDAEAGSDPNPS